MKAITAVIADNISPPVINDLYETLALHGISALSSESNTFPILYRNMKFAMDVMNTNPSVIFKLNFSSVLLEQTILHIMYDTNTVINTTELTINDLKLDLNVIFLQSEFRLL